MKPATVLMAIVFGSATAISFGLCGTWLIFALLQSDHPQMANDLPKLARSCLVFISLAGVAGLTLYGTFKNRGWRFGSGAATWGMLLLIGWMYWPTR